MDRQLAHQLEARDLLLDAVLERREVLLAQVEHRMAGLVEHGGVELDELDLDLLGEVGRVDEDDVLGRVAVGLEGDRAHVADRAGRRELDVLA